MDVQKSPTGQFQIVLCNRQFQGVSFITYHQFKNNLNFCVQLSKFVSKYLTLQMEGMKSDREGGETENQAQLLKFLLKCTRQADLNCLRLFCKLISRQSGKPRLDHWSKKF